MSFFVLFCFRPSKQSRGPEIHTRYSSSLKRGEGPESIRWLSPVLGYHFINNTRAGRGASLRSGGVEQVLDGFLLCLVEC